MNSDFSSHSPVSQRVLPASDATLSSSQQSREQSNGPTWTAQEQNWSPSFTTSSEGYAPSASPYNEFVMTESTGTASNSLLADMIIPIRLSQPSEALKSIKWGDLQQQSFVNWVPSAPIWVPSTVPSTCNEATMTNTATMPYTEWLPLPDPIHNRHDYRRPQKTKRHKQQILDRIKQTYETAERGQYRQERALAWWRAWEHLQAAQHEVDVRTTWQMETPNHQNSLRLHTA